MDSIIQEAPTDWMRLPKLENKLAIHTERNTGARRGESAEVASEVSGALLRVALLKRNPGTWRLAVGQWRLARAYIHV